VSYGETGLGADVQRARGAHDAGMRKGFAILLAGVGILLTAVVGAGCAVWSAAEVNTAGKREFAQALRIPPLLEPRADASGRKVFDLALRAGRAELRPGTTTETWGINGPHLGPTLRAARGDRVLMRVSNRLPEATTLHWHGMHLPARADGGPHQMIEPGATWAPSWTIDQPAASLWYHPHMMGRTEDHAYRGLAGIWIVDDPGAGEHGLPHEYGVDDVPLILQDKRLDDDGGLDFGRGVVSPIGRLGDDVLVNGTYDPHLRVRHRRVRFRLLNASTARIYNLGLADGREFALVGTDGGLLERPTRMKRIQLSVGERAEIVVDFRPGERVVLRSYPPDLDTDVFNDRFSGGDDTLDLLELRADDSLTGGPELPDRLAELEPLDTAGAPTRRFELSGSSGTDGRDMDPHRIDEVVRLASTEVWEVRNRSGIPHNFHVHDIRFRILDYAGEAPSPHLRGWKDTVYVPPGETVRFAARFDGRADHGAPYMFHCHLLQHEDRGMMGQFTVVEPGESPHAPPAHDRHAAG
jgi:blue copper oxidase